MPDELTPTPASILKQAIRAVPAVRYALGVAGIIAVIAIVKGYGLDFRVAIFGTVIMFVLMTVLVVFARAVADRKSDFRLPALFFTWFALVLTVATATALFFSAFFNVPLDFRKNQQQVLNPSASDETAKPTAPGSDTNAPPDSAQDSWWVGKFVRTYRQQTTTFEIIEDSKNLRAKISNSYNVPGNASAAHCEFTWNATLSPTGDPDALSYTTTLSNFSGDEETCNYSEAWRMSGELRKIRNDIYVMKCSYWRLKWITLRRTVSH
jgi:hypothetical protein